MCTSYTQTHIYMYMYKQACAASLMACIPLYMLHKSAHTSTHTQTHIHTTRTNTYTHIYMCMYKQACAASLMAYKDRMIVETDYGQAPPPPPLAA